MASTFRGLETGKSGLIAASINQDITGQNIANANTPGYTRQRTVAVSRKPAGTDYVISQVYNKMVGQGVSITDVQQLRSDYLDKQYRDKNSTFNRFEFRQQGMTYLTGVMKELNDSSSLTVCLQNFSSAFQKLSENATSQENRLNVQQQAITLTQNVGYVYDQMVGLWADQNQSVKTVAETVNSKIERIAMLNQAIASYERTGTTANELRDDRNLLLDELSGLVNITYNNNATNGKMIDVQIGGIEVVTGNTTKPIEINESTDVNPASQQKYYVLSIDGTELKMGSEITDGELYAHMELVSSDSADTPGIPYYISQLNGFAQQIAKTINDIHKTGFTYPHDGTDSTDGLNFFEVPVDGGGNEDYSLITGGNFSISQEVKESVWNIAASAVKVDLSAESTNAENSKVATRLYELISGGEYNATLNSIVAHIGIASKTTKGLLDTSDSLLDSVDSQRTSLSGVSMNEETTNLIKFQQSYNVAARMITTIDEMLNTLINGTGRVGL